MTPVELHTSIGLGWTLLAALLLLTFSGWSYRRIRPPGPVWLRILLASLRGIALVLLLLLVVDFQVRWESEEPEQKRVAVLVDRSESMGLRDSQGPRDKTVRELLRTPFWEEVRQSRRLEWITYAGAARTVNGPGDIGEADGPVTNLEQAFTHLAVRPQERVDAVVLISDGAVNRGGSPGRAARRLGAPVFVVAVGDSLPPRDLAITETVGPNLAYQGEELPLNVTVRGTRLEGERTVVRVVNETGRELARDTVQFRSDTEEHTLEFKLTPDRAGLADWRVEAAPVPDEVREDNNQRHAAVRVSERRRTVILFASVPSPDASFLAKALEDDKDTAVRVMIAGGPGGRLLRGDAPTDAQLGEVDGIIALLDSPVTPSAMQIWRQLADSGLPMMVLTGFTPSRRALEPIADRIGGLETAPALETVQLEPAKLHPVFTIEGRWWDLDTSPPPLSVPGYIAAGGVTIAYTTDTERPVVVEGNGAPRTLVWFAGGLWRWNLSVRPLDPTGQGMRGLLERTVRWLVTSETEERISVEPSADLYTGGEVIELTGRVRDEGLRPVDDAVITAEVRRGGTTRTIELQPLGGGRYSSRVQPWGEGRYSMTATVETGSGSYTRTAEFVVDRFNLETTDPRMRPGYLRAVAQSTGGVFLLPEEIDSLPEQLPVSRSTSWVQHSWDPFGRWSTLLLIVGLFALEWLIRTRRGML
ncbi:hypothetical protein GF324_06060 [bacterium]|nr:hypothetical protein [bacterium]